MIKGEPGVPGGGPFDALLDDICNSLSPLQLSGQFAGDYLRRDDVIRLVSRHAERGASNQSLRIVLLLNDLMMNVMKCTTFDTDKLYASSVTREFMLAIANLNTPATSNKEQKNAGN